MTATRSRASRTGQGPGRWLLLFHQLPPQPAYLRVKVRRRLQRIGAVQLKNTVYVLPHTSETLEDLQWLRGEIIAGGGEATVCSAGFIEGVSDREVEQAFRAACDAEYGELTRAAKRMRATATAAAIARLRDQLADIAARDFFDAPKRRDAEGAIMALQQRIRRAAPSDETPRPTAAAAPRGATWVTREGVHVDRIASAWLIRRFIDPKAQFKFVPAKGYRAKKGEFRFDMFEGEFTHEGGRCTFEVLLDRFGLGDPALRAIAEVVHDIDLKDGKFGRDEAPGIAAVIRGIGLAHADDAARLATGAGVFEGLYARFRAQD